ncbi:MAG: phage head-tail connector protein [Gemmataceae bacterium]|nr:phage head-tail connector protein [Gemmataceae bacterium]
MPVDTLTNVKTRLGISTSADDGLLGLLMDSAERWIAEYTGRNLAGGTFTEYFPGQVEWLCLANFPISSVTSVKVDASGAFGPDSLLSPTDYVIHAERGVIQSRRGPFLAASRNGLVNADRSTWTRHPRAVQVVYSVTAPVPDDVKHAHALLVGHWYRRVKTQAAAGFQNLGHQRYGEIDVSYQQDGSIPDEVASLLARYRTSGI